MKRHEISEKQWNRIACFLYGSGFYVSVVNAILIHSYGNNSPRWAKTDKKDAIKLTPN